MRIFENTDYKFISKRRTAYVVSGVLLLMSVFGLLTRGLETGIDFQGGTEFVIETGEVLPIPGVRDALSAAFGVQPEVKTYDNDHTLLIRTTAGGDDIDAIQQSAVTAVSSAFPQATVSVIKIDSVGPRFAEDLKRGAFYAVIASLFVIFLYVWLRFEWQFSLGAVAALAHDVTITLGIFAMFHHLLPFSLQIDQAIIAALLTIVGYSLNDTVVVFDRIREFTNLFKTEPYAEIVDRSINSTLSRTLVTSGTTLIVVLTLFIFGGEVLRGFAFALLVGIVIGTYSSIFVASPILVELKTRALAAR
ncbi:MAG: protein translocase subunit SecF [Rhodothermales bacterium]